MQTVRLQKGETQRRLKKKKKKSTQKQKCNTLMATGYIVPPISKLPFLNIMTDVLLTQVPAETRHQIALMILNNIIESLHQTCREISDMVMPTFRKY